MYDLANKMTSEQVAEAQRAADAFLEVYEIGSYQVWRRMAITASLSMPPGERRVFGGSWWYAAVRVWYPVVRWWWLATTAIRATLSPPGLPDALTATGSSGTPACMAATTTPPNV